MHAAADTGALYASLDLDDFGVVLDVLSRELSTRPGQTDWADLTLFIAQACSQFATVMV